MTRVLHVGPLPPPFGGVAVAMQSLMRAEPLQGFDHTCFNISWGTSWEVVGYKCPTVKRVTRRLVLASQLALHVRRLRPHIVHFQCGSGGRWDFPGDMSMFYGARVSGAKMIFHWHRDPRTATFPGHSFITERFFQATAGKADAVFVLSEVYQETLKDSEIADKISVVPNTFNSALLSLPCPRPRKDRVQITFLGRLTREKGIFDLLQVASIIADKVPNVNFALAGTPDPYEGGIAKLEKEIANLGLESSVSMVGSVTGKAKIGFLKQADILLLPSYRESFGMVALEGMAAGIPVVAYEIGILPELITKARAGFLVKPSDIHSLSHRLFQLIEDPALRERMGRDGRAEVRQKYALDVVANKVRQIYATLVEA